MAHSRTERKADSAVCPSCDRFAGAVDECPYCGADMARSWSLGRFRALTLAFAACGLGFLLLMARHRELPVVRAGEIVPTMNFGYVRVVGHVKRKPYVASDDGVPGYMSFSLVDASGEVRVVAYRKQAQALWSAGLMPAKGDRVDVCGSLRVSERGEPRLVLETVRHLRVMGEDAQGEEPRKSNHVEPRADRQ